MKWLKSGVILVVFLSVANGAPTLLADDDETLRLPGDSVPIHYDINLVTNVHAGRRNFEGNVKIQIEIIKTTGVITLHSRQLTVSSVNLYENDGSKVENTEFSLNADKDFLTITSASKPLNEGEKYTLDIAFNGNLQTGTSGFYLSSYQMDGTRRFLAATQFESTNARSAFPCYDEPEFKAVFKLSITHNSAYNAIANTEGTVSEIIDDTVTTSFKESPKMSSYLLAFVVSDYGVISNDARGRTYEIFARPDSVHKAELALKLTREILTNLEAYAIYNYELSKMTSAAISDFGAGAMENWGLITYKEQYLIGDETSHHRDILEIYKTVAHELGHQFFGNLVTCQWWNYIWLNEGFATVFEYLLPQVTYSTSMRFGDFFNVQKLQNALKVDALESTRPMSFNAETPSGISGLFDRIAYDKSGTVIRMFQYAVGEDIFRIGLKEYLNTNNHRPVTPEDFYLALQKVMDEKNFKDFNFATAFKTWETQKGYPIIHVSYSSGTAELKITQDRYYALTEKRVENDDRNWFIPLNIATENNPNFEDTKFTNYFSSGEKTMTIPTSGLTQFDPSKWFIFNKQQLGYYRVNYDIENWKKIIETLNSDRFTDIHVLNRAQLIDDALNFAYDGYLSYDIAFGVLNYLNRETDYFPWYAATTNLEKLDYLYSGFQTYAQFKAFVKDLNRRTYAKFQYKQLTDHEDDLVDKFARELSIDWACRMGDEKCLKNAAKMLQIIAKNETAISASLQSVYICNGFRASDNDAAFVSIYQRMQDSIDQAERLRLIDGLLCSSNPKYIKNLLETALIQSQKNYKTHERQRIFNNFFIRSSVGISVALEFIDEYFDDLRSTYGSIDNLLIAISKRTAQYDDQVKITELMDKFADKLQSTTKETVLNYINDNKEFLASDKYIDIVVNANNALNKISELEGQLILPNTSIPSSYIIHLDVRNIHTGARAYTGHVQINSFITQKTSYIMLHSRDQEIDELKVFENDGVTEIEVMDYSLHPATDTLTIYFMEEIDTGTVIIDIKYSTNLLTYGSGFYQTSYVTNGTTRYLGATQFESCEARLAVPCYDEPKYKAIFELKITHNKQYSAIANTLGKEVSNNDDTVTTSFAPSPVMSSYLLAFVVSDLVPITNTKTMQPGDTIHRIWVRPDSVLKAPYALDNSILALKELEKYVRYNYELPKVDSAGIPAKGGAMENWGMVTYRENAMIYEENYDDIPHTQKYSGVSVIAHELAHQFFGNAVTCEWWSYIWLNEGFATLFQYQLTDSMYPTWRMRSFFNTRNMHSSFRSDALPSTRAMTTDALTPTEIDNLFDNIAYNKAGSVLRMFQYAVGDDVFRDSLEDYVHTNDHKAANSQHLMDAFTRTLRSGVSNLEFDLAFRTWENQKGFPLVHISFDKEMQLFEISQQRFFTDRTLGVNDTSSWFIPLNFATSSNPDFEDTLPSFYFDNGQQSTRIPTSGFEELNNSEWFIFNKQQLGYYRVNYDISNWEAIIKTLNTDDYDKIHVLNRVQLIDDSITFADIGYLNYDIVFGILEYLERETDYFPWYSADRLISQLYTVFGRNNKVLNGFVRHISEKLYDHYKVPEDFIIPVDDLVERYAREIALRLACNSGNEVCLEDTYIQNHLIAGHERKIPNGLESVIYCSGFRGIGKETEWIAMWKQMQASSDATFRSRIIIALGCTEEKKLLKDLLETTLSSNNDASYTLTERRNVFNSVLSSYSALPAILEFLTEYELDILSRYQYPNLQTLLSNVARIVWTNEQLEIFNTYLASNNRLSVEIYDSVFTIASNNIKQQELPKYSAIMEILQKIMDRINPQTDAPTNAPTNAPTSTSTVAITTSTTSTEVPSATTLGAETIGINFITITIMVIVALVMKN